MIIEKKRSDEDVGRSSVSKLNHEDLIKRIDEGHESHDDKEEDDDDEGVRKDGSNQDLVAPEADVGSIQMSKENNQESKNMIDVKDQDAQQQQ